MDLFAGTGEHTGATDGGTAYFEPDDNWPIGGFKCLHGHCAERRVRDLLGLLGIEINAARMKPTIRIVAGEIHRVVDAAERELAQSRRHYQRGGLIVTVVTDPGTRETRVQDVSQPALVRALDGAALWERYDGRAQDWQRTDPPARHAGVMFDSTSYPHLAACKPQAGERYFSGQRSGAAAAGQEGWRGSKALSRGAVLSRDSAGLAGSSARPVTERSEMMQHRSQPSDLLGTLLGTF